ncbi:protein of unknown function [Ruminococcaceae bacterium BL-6]|nr:protein of unknown function [Ruminococcaceae bacterium BL-6]
MNHDELCGFGKISAQVFILLYNHGIIKKEILGEKTGPERMRLLAHAVKN